MSTELHIWTFKALTPLWTGDANGKKELLIPTGLLGSIRWWFEVVARGLGGQPCDPSKTKCIDRKHCVACELFGCTGWARKFRLDVLGANGSVLKDQITKGQTLKLRFTPLRAIAPEEWALLNLTLRLIAEHGAIGGKTVFKPTDEHTRRNELHHQDFGIIELIKAPDGVPSTNRTALEAYARHSRWHNARQNGFAWASLTNFWSVPGRYLARQDAGNSTINRVLGRGEHKNQAGTGDSWLAGRRARSGDHNSSKIEAESKKVISFREPPRTYGFVNPTDGDDAITLDTIKQRLEAAWGSRVSVDQAGEAGNRIRLLTGPRILQGLLTAEEA